MSLAVFLAQHADVIEVRLERVRGSAPRDTGTVMFVAASSVHGTIGGGQLEYMAIDKARTMLRAGLGSAEMDVPLGPEIGQCCGGRVVASLSWMSEEARAAAVEADEVARSNAPHVYILGAGHVGRALTDLFQHLPVRCILIDGRQAELDLSKAKVEKRLSVLTEMDVRAAPEGSAFIVLTHDHALDFLLASEALARGDAAYVGMIGSATKRAKFAAFCRAEAPEISVDALVCPIGANGSRDKRPEVIAAFVAAEVMSKLTAPAHQFKETTD
ncbi:MAG: xanthine dehydrogenase accessory protein XdhC [Pseudomonadota bacterium]